MGQVMARLGMSAVPPVIRELIMLRGQGHPFFCTELCQATPRRALI